MVIFTAISLLIMAYSFHFRVWPILMFFALWLPLPLWRGGIATLKPISTLLLILAIPLLCIASTLWSSHPGTTFYLSTAFLALNLCIWISGRIVPFSAWVEGICIGISLILLLTLSNGTFVIEPATKQPVLLGLFSSKNQVGFAAEIGILASIALSMADGARWRRYSILLVTIGVCVTCLYLSRSITAFLSLMVVLGALPVVLLLRRLPKTLQLTGLALICFTLLASAIAFVAFDGQQHLLQMMGKDTTLTGRTYLWQQGLLLAQESPWVGRGYSAFWVHGEPLAERYWQEFYITARTGFHFHHTFIQAMVDLGVLGVALIAVLMLWSLIATLRRALDTHADAEALFLFALALMFAIRAWFEIDIFTGPFGMGAFLFYAILPRLARRSVTRNPFAAAPVSPASAPSPA